ncbi:MAG: glycoside hydrolase family 130 protein [Anaerolineaceae bacterium]|nr:glycoside hydrolase family 130 protein [Anaerolineaceae bacterium]
MPVQRSEHNPILRPQDVKPSRPDFEVTCVLNAAVTRLGDEIILLLRVAERPIVDDPQTSRVPIFDPAKGELVLREFSHADPHYNFSDPRGISGPEGHYLTTLSYLRLARSKDGIHFTVEDQPALFPATEYETFGIEDPRISKIGDTYYIDYVAVSPNGIVTALASTQDFVTYERLGIIFAPDNKDCMLFPEKINGKYYALHRPCISGLGKPQIWLAESPDLLNWGRHRMIAGLRLNGWEDLRIGGSAPPFRVPQGWLEIYHGAGPGNRYCLGALLLDTDQPWKVLARSAQPFMQPEAKYELKGFFGNVVFTCGVLCEDGIVKIYYGAADEYMAYAEAPLQEILDGLELVENR